VILRSRAMLLLLVVPVSVVLLLVATPPVEDFGLHSDRWTGLSSVAEELDTEAVWSLSELERQVEPTTLLLVPRKPVTRKDVSGLASFVEAGGTLVLMDDFGYGNDLLSGLGLDMTLADGELLDPVLCEKNENMPLATIADPEAKDGSLVLQLNHATWLETGEGVEVLGASSRFSFGDVDHSGIRDHGEPAGPLPVAASCAMGDGRVVVVADCSILINGMVGMEDNLEFLSGFADGPVLVAATHLPDSGADGGKRVVASLRAALQTYAGMTVAVSMVLAVTLLYPWYNRRRRYAY